MSIGTLLLFVGGAILLAFFCSLGIIARMREHRIEERREEKRAMQRSSGAREMPDQVADPVGQQRRDGAAGHDAHQGP